MEKTFVVFTVPAYSRNVWNGIKKGRKVYFSQQQDIDLIYNKLPGSHDRRRTPGKHADLSDGSGIKYHSFRSDSTGSATAARIACQLTVSKAITTAANPATANIHDWISILYAK